MSHNNPYESFPHFVLRAPVLPCSLYEELTSESKISKKQLKEFFNKTEVKEAIFLASPNLFNELNKWANNQIRTSKEIKKLEFSLLKYISRMTSRCTPFGLFAGCAVGNFSENSSIILKNPIRNSRHTRLDMNYLVSLSQNLAKDINIRNQILFYPNTSIYKTGDQLRYVEFEYINGKRKHRIVEVDDSIYLKKVLENTKNGLSLKEIINLLIDEENSEEIVVGFVDELVESQILINELEPSISGPEFLEHIISVLSKIKGTKKQLETLYYVKNELSLLDKNFINDPKQYLKISNELKKLKTNIDIKFLFQTDVILNPSINTIDGELIKSIKKGMCLFNKITLPSKKNPLKDFKDAFRERYEEREIPLAIALDVENGVGYLQNQSSLENNPLIDDLFIPAGVEDSKNEISWSIIDSIFQKKFLEAIKNDDFIIRLSDGDFKDLKENWNDLPDTISTMIEIVLIEGQQKYKFSSIGGSSAANPLTRFCHGDQNLKKFVKEIIEEENQFHSNEIVADIVHLPESRVGNILIRPSLRKYEIPYLARSVSTGEDQQLSIQDLTISIKQNNVFLKSSRFNKRVIPQLANMHNYSHKALPIYHFLCDLQTQNKRSYIGINLGPIANEYDFIPRIEYDDLIISEAMWNLTKSDIKNLLLVKDDDEKLSAELVVFRENRKMPILITLNDGDNQLLIKLNNLTSVRMFLDIVKKRSHFRLKEFLFCKDGIVKGINEGEYFTNQIILSFYDSSKRENGK